MPREPLAIGRVERVRELGARLREQVPVPVRRRRGWTSARGSPSPPRGAVRSRSATRRTCGAGRGNASPSGMTLVLRESTHGRPEVAAHEVAVPHRATLGRGEHAAVRDGYRPMCSPIISARNRGTVIVRRLPVFVGPSRPAAHLAQRLDDVDGAAEHVHPVGAKRPQLARPVDRRTRRGRPRRGSARRSSSASVFTWRRRGSASPRGADPAGARPPRTGDRAIRPSSTAWSRTPGPW